MTTLEHTPDNPGLPLEPEQYFTEPRAEILQTVDDYRRLARDIYVRVETGQLQGSGPNGWPALVVDLAATLRHEDEPVRGWAQRAVFEELRCLWGDDPDDTYPHAPPPTYQDPLRRLVRAGHKDCPTCRLPLPMPDDFERWSRLAIDEAQRRDERKEAINR